MAGVFDISGQSKYDDGITERYHLPNKTNLAVVKGLVRSWVVFRETRAAKGRMAYIAAAFLSRIDLDSRDPTHSYARVSNLFRAKRMVCFGQIAVRPNCQSTWTASPCARVRESRFMVT